MPDRIGRFRWVPRVGRLALIASMVFIVALIVYSAIWFAYILGQGFGDAQFIFAYALSIAFLVAIAFWLFVTFGLVRITTAAERGIFHLRTRMEQIESLLETSVQYQQKLVEISQLSEQARNLLYKDRELEVFCEAVRHDLLQQNYSSAEILIDSIESSGASGVAETLREELEQSKQSTTIEKIDNAVARIEVTFQQYDWNTARRQISRLVTFFPDNEKIVLLPEKLNEAKTKRKRDLLQQYGDAVRRNAVDNGIELLKQLDAYLTPQEASALRDSARGVFKSKLQNLGVQFAICITDKRWADAADTAEQIIQGFPNSRMAHEVSDKIDQLYAKSAESEKLRSEI